MACRVQPAHRAAEVGRVADEEFRACAHHINAAGRMAGQRLHASEAFPAGTHRISHVRKERSMKKQKKSPALVIFLVIVAAAATAGYFLYNNLDSAIPEE